MYKQNVHPFSSGISEVLDFLADQFEAGMQHRSLNGYRSAISSCHLPVDGFSVGQHPLVSRLLKGVFNLRPPQPKYSHTWEVCKMLDHLKSLGPNDSFSLEQLTRKLAMLLALVMAHRASNLVTLSVVGRTYTPEGVVLTCSGLAKTSKPSNLRERQSVVVTFFGQVELCPCPVSCLRAYEVATEKFRFSDDRMQLFSCTIVPHAPVTSSTISRWLKKTLHEATVGEQFSGHSTRSAASTAAASAGITTQEVMNRAGCSSENTFCKFYYRPSDKIGSVQRFSEAVLNDSTNNQRSP